jgi:transposase-like protein
MSSAALANYRKARAVELALAGASYDDIAREIGLANQGTAWRYVDRALRERRFAR